MQGATVLLVPAAPLADVQELYTSVVTDQNGDFFMRDVRPGTYTAYAWQDISNGAWFSPGFKDAARGRGVAVEFGKGEEKRLQLRVIPAGRTVAPGP
jgi:Polysaccharide lyase family 4, domain II